VSNRDWVKIKNELNELLSGPPKDDRETIRNRDLLQTARADEHALLAHIADALVQHERT
jgi:hypothetical protein